MGTNGDNPTSAETNAHNVKEGDILVVGSDGLWDNMHRSKIVEVIKPFLRGGKSITDSDAVAEVIAKEAEKFSYL